MIKTIAIIGSGIAGLSAARQLDADYQVSIFEKNDYFGGHTDTHSLDINGRLVDVDTGFIVFNTQHYPNFCHMLDQLDVESQPSDMSFAVNNSLSGLSYNPSGLSQLLRQPAQLLRRDYRQMLADLWRFYNAHRDADLEKLSSELTLGDYLAQHHYTAAFAQEHLYPMTAALWSLESDNVAALPVKFVLKFFQNHNMLQLTARPEWLTVRGGSNAYVEQLRIELMAQWMNAQVLCVERTAHGVSLHTATSTHEFDAVVFACNAPQALALLAQPTPEEKQILGAFQVSNNRMVLHSDSRIMPKRRALWASWNVHINGSPAAPTYAITYWMNRLQNLSTKTPLLASLNPNTSIDESSIWVERHYQHPIYDAAAFAAQAQWAQINAQQHSYFCGAYWGWGFHEDGVTSGQRVAQLIDARA